MAATSNWLASAWLLTAATTSPAVDSLPGLEFKSIETALPTTWTNGAPAAP